MDHFYGPASSGPMFMGYIYCEGSEESLIYCRYNHWLITSGSYYSSHRYDTSIYCPPGLSLHHTILSQSTRKSFHVLFGLFVCLLKGKKKIYLYSALL